MSNVLNFTCTKQKVKFILYTVNDKSGTVLTIDNIKTSSFNPKDPVKFIVHGYRASAYDLLLVNLIKELLKYSEVNIISVDWSQLSYTVFYPLAISRSKYVAEIVSDLIFFLINNCKISMSQIHLIGHSLGAQCAGFIGKNIFTQTGHKINRISALDPASPLFEFPILVKESQRLTKDDAEFVDVIHTNRGIQGFSAPVGHVDFYPNDGGPIQPGCGNIGINCSHHRCIQYYTESINNDNFVSYKCDSWNKFCDGQCLNSETANLGYHVDPNTRGVFYLHTNSNPPFAITYKCSQKR